jgi:hypothetical protein
MCVRARAPNSNKMEGEEASGMINDSVLWLEFVVTVLESCCLV